MLYWGWLCTIKARRCLQLSCASGKTTDRLWAMFDFVLRSHLLFRRICSKAMQAPSNSCSQILFTNLGWITRLSLPVPQTVCKRVTSDGYIVYHVAECNCPRGFTNCKVVTGVLICATFAFQTVNAHFHSYFVTADYCGLGNGPYLWRLLQGATVNTC